MEYDDGVPYNAANKAKLKPYMFEHIIWDT